MARYALVVGISKYQSHPMLPNLEKTATDAEAVAKVLHKYGDYDITLLTGEVTAAKLGEALKKLLLKQAVINEALIYLTGHGITGVTGSDVLQSPQVYLAASDCALIQTGNQWEVKGGSISLNSLNKLIESALLNNLVVILDSCHSGEFLEGNLVKNSLTVFSYKRDYFFIAACREFEEASAKKSEPHSIFTGALLEGLKPEQAEEGQVRVGTLFDFIARELKKKNSNQEPFHLGYGRSLILVTYQPQKQEPSPINEECPYQGLFYFTEETAPYFFGRKKLTEQLKQKLKKGTFIPVIGASGSGKSSVVRAGLIPWLRGERNWHILEPIFPSSDPLMELKQALKPLFERGEQEQIYEAIDRGIIEPIMEKLPQGKQFLLLVDQFEEVFTLCPKGKEKERDKFIDLLTQGTKIEGSPLAVVITLRADFLTNCLDYKSLTSLIEQQAVYMPRLTNEELQEIIKEPAKKQGYILEDSLLQALLNDIPDKATSLPLLEFTLTQLWGQATQQGHCMKLQQYHKLGKISKILTNHAEAIYKGIKDTLGQVGIDCIERICVNLVTTDMSIKDLRRRQTKEEILALAGDQVEQEIINKVLDRLIDERLLMAYKDLSNSDIIELSHESLVESWIKKWLPQDPKIRTQIEIFRCLYRNWKVHNNQDLAHLLSGSEVSEAKSNWQLLKRHLPSGFVNYLKTSEDYLTNTINRDLSIKDIKYEKKTQFNSSSLTSDLAPDVEKPISITIECDRSGLSIETVKLAFLDNLFYLQGIARSEATIYDYYVALAYTIRDRLLHRFLKTAATYKQEKVKVVSYFSVEFLMGRHLGNNLINLGIYQQVQQVVEDLGIDFDELLEQEPDPGLGNGGLGRLAACFLDSLASLGIPAIGYGIRYEFGIFQQIIQEGWQVEIPDNWLRFGNPWELPRPDETVEVKLGGYTEIYYDENGHPKVIWISDRAILAIPHDTPVPGYKTNTVNTLRLWKAESSESLNFEAFNAGHYDRAVEEKMDAETISKVLYPNDNTPAGRELRLAQEYFLSSASIQDLIRLHLRNHYSLDDFHEKVAVQLNDTHPAVAIPELMRLLIDNYGYDWERAWDITQKTFAYTNHTLMPEDLERWPVSLFGKLLPRHLEIIYELNHRFLEDIRIWFPEDEELPKQVSLVEEFPEKQIRMANLACVGSHAINGVAALHTELLKQDTLRDFAQLWPEKFYNKTNGVTPRRWMLLSNPRLAALIIEKIGDNWLKHLDELRRLEAFIDDPDFCRRWYEIKQANKQDLAAYILRYRNIEVDVNSLFDVQVKHIHEYERQHLAVLHIIDLYNRIKHNPYADILPLPRTFIFSGKANPGSFMAKLIIKLINAVGEVVNKDPEVRGRLKVVFLPNFNVSLEQRIYPAADLSEQISTAGTEVSGMGNMELSMNGALTIGTLDGANIEIREEVGTENFFLFGLTTEEVYTLKGKGYHPIDYYNRNPDLQGAIDLIASGYFSYGDRELFKPLVESLLYGDTYMLMADYQAYIDCQEDVSQAYQDRDNWTRMSILNVARMGKFSSDRSIREYCQEIWQVEPVKIELETYSQVNALLKV